MLLRSYASDVSRVKLKLNSITVSVKGHGEIVKSKQQAFTGIYYLGLRLKSDLARLQ